jgi:hypothetical protein
MIHELIYLGSSPGRDKRVSLAETKGFLWQRQRAFSGRNKSVSLAETKGFLW